MNSVNLKKYKSNMMKKRILLTGVTGFLGSHLAKSLLSFGYEIIALKRKSSSLHRVESTMQYISCIDIDGLDFDEIFRRCGKIDAIIHTATCYGRNDESVSEIFGANTEFPLRLLDAGSRAGVGLFLNTDTILDKYLNLYALSKNQLLQWGKYFSIHKKIRFLNIKLEHFYGPDDDPSKFSAYVITSCISNLPELKLTKGEQKRDFIHIDDVVSAYILLLEKMSSFDISFIEFDVGSGQSISIKEFVETVHRLTKSNTILAFGAIPYREGEVMSSEADISGLLKLGWQCRYDIEAGIKIVLTQELIRS
jgi:nucleoside-diphosphate-sugar epimerase